MILSFHPCFEGDKNILCAGRDPDAADLDAIQSAKAVILPQGCRESLYRMAKSNCLNVFPNYDTRFQYPGKIKQIELFSKINVEHPRSILFENTDVFYDAVHDLNSNPLFQPPFVFKFDWGGEGRFVYLIESPTQLKETLKLAKTYENTGQYGFLIQEFIPGENRTLRVVVIHETIISYWRVHKKAGFHTNLSKGAVIDKNFAPDLREEGEKQVKDFCRKTHINLAGFDLIFSMKTDPPKSFLIEINYFFGRKGLGGSENYYKLLSKAIWDWIKKQRLEPVTSKS